MERQWLRDELERGRSIESIAREVEKHPSTVSYLVNKYGLASSRASRHSTRGPMDEAGLRVLIERGFSIREIASEYRRSASSIRHWIEKFGLRTEPRNYARRDGRKPAEIFRECRIHGWTTFRRVGDDGTYRCPQCGAARVA